jgi:hypothetical protein
MGILGTQARRRPSSALASDYPELTPKVQTEPKDSFPTEDRTVSLNRSTMDKHRIFAIALAIAASWHLVPEVRAQQDDFPSAFDKCRTVTTEDIIDKRAPTFDAYRATSPETVEKIHVSTCTARMYRTVLRREIAKGPNFAGHYRVAVWGCGSSCSMFAVVNLNTGRVITPEGFSHTSGVYFGVENQKVFPKSQRDYWLFGFTKDSSLLVILGDLDEDENREGAFYFVLDHESLRLIHSTPVRKNCENLRIKH